MDTLFQNRRIEQFMAIYEAQNIRRASETLGITQPALTVSLRNLELELGYRLFDRSVKGMTPTQAADTLYRFGVTLQQAGGLVRNEMRRLGGDGGGRLRIGAGVAWTTTVMPGLLREMHRQIPDLSIDLISGVGDQLATRLIDGELDVVLTAGLVEGLGNKEFRRDLLGNMDMKVVADPESRLGRKRKISASDLVSVDWVGFYEDEVIVQQSRHFLALRGLPPANFVVRSNSPATLTAFLKGTEFISVLIGPLVSAARNAGLIELQLDEPLWQLPVGLYYRRVAEHSNTLMTFNALCSDAVHVFS